MSNSIGSAVNPNQIIDWPGLSGKSYRYWFLIRPSGDGIQPVSGNYAFVKQVPNGNFTILYFGETDNLRERISNHEKLDDAKRLGMTHIMAHTTPAGATARLAEEADLIQKWQPPLNIQKRQVS
jgi:hypothetical protein